MALSGFLCGAVGAAMIVAAHHTFGLPDWEIWASLLRSRNNFSAGNMILMATAAGIFFALGIRAGIKESDRSLAYAAAIAIGLTVGLHARSRTALLILIVSLLVAVLSKSRSLRAVLGGLVVAAGLAAMAWQFSPNVQSRFVETISNLRAVAAESNYRTSVGVRWRMYAEAVKGMAEHPILGTGVGSWLPRWRTAALPLDEGLPEDQKRVSEINNPHNDFLLAGMETGVPGLLMLVWLLARFG